MIDRKLQARYEQQADLWYNAAEISRKPDDYMTAALYYQKAGMEDAAYQCTLKAQALEQESEQA